jgi:hypothetical protein
MSYTPYLYDFYYEREVEMQPEAQEIPVVISATTNLALGSTKRPKLGPNDASSSQAQGNP